MELNRNRYLNVLESWAKSQKPKPLLLWGARQVGKTHLMLKAAERFFGEYYYLNFERDKQLALLFRESLDPEKIIQNLTLYLDKDIKPESALFIFDEIQECEDALNSLKYFAESPLGFKVMAAGSLLGVKRSKKGFPVGKVQFLDIHPLNFVEFLEFTGHKKMAQFLAESKLCSPMNEGIHTSLSRLQREYCWTGGMPEVVAAYATAPNNTEAVRSIQNQIIQSYQLDFAKHAPSELVSKIGAVFQQIPKLLAKENKKFSFTSIGTHARARDYSEALQWLMDARMVHKVKNISQIDLPLESHAHEGTFKVYPLDVGLLGALLEVPAKLVLEQEGIFSQFKGALAECFVAEELISYGFSKLYYWTSSGSAEVDFIVHQETQILPLEVKSGVNLRSKSLSLFGERYPHCSLTRLSTRNFENNGRFKNYPLYSLSVFSNFARDVTS